MSSAARHLWVAALAAVACGNARPVVDGHTRCVNWKDDIQPLFARDCARCHPAGSSVDLTSYAGALAVRDKMEAALGTATHTAVADDAPTVSSWLDRCDASYFHSYIHPGGWVDPSSADFHGTTIKNAAYNMGTCQKCHGDDFRGGASGVSCWSCHTQGGPTGCTTCHGQPPQTGAHVAHTSRYFDCTTCHVKPMVYTDAGHLDGKVTVTLSQGSYTDGRCSGVYCHGGGFPGTDTNAKNPAPLWTGGSGEVACGSCHGLAPSNHARSTCIDCHPKVIDAAGNLDPTRHIDGKISIGDESGTCQACHTTDPAKLSGAHLAHLTAPLGLRGPLACTDCHVLPASTHDPAHPTTPLTAVEYTNGRCTNSKCHLAATPAWTDGPSVAYCGTCHDVPPADAKHPATLRLTQCVTCHPTTMDATGLLVPGGTHINGVVDAQ